MFWFIKKVFVFLWNQKKLLAFIIFLTVLLFSLRFPWNTLLEKTVKSIQKQSPVNIQTDFDKLQFRFFPPGLEFQNLSLYYNRKVVLLDSFRVSLFLSKWLALKKAWRIHLAHGESSLYLDFWKEEKESEDDSDISLDIYFLRGESPSFQLEFLKFLFPHIKAAGKITARFDFEGHQNRLEEVKASMELKGENIHFSKLEIATHLGPLSLPSIKWTNGEMEIYFKEGELVFKKIRMGAPSDPFIVQIKGSASLLYSYGSLRFNSYDLQIQIDEDKGFPMSLLNLMFAGYKEDKGSFFRYRFRATGQGGQVPDMEKLEDF